MLKREIAELKGGTIIYDGNSTPYVVHVKNGKRVAVRKVELDNPTEWNLHPNPRTGGPTDLCYAEDQQAFMQNLSHSEHYVTAYIRPDGAVAHMWKGDAWTRAKMISTLDKMITAVLVKVIDVTHEFPV